MFEGQIENTKLIRSQGPRADFFCEDGMGQGIFYHVRCKDGDQEDYTLSEVLPHVVQAGVASPCTISLGSSSLVTLFYLALTCPCMNHRWSCLSLPSNEKATRQTNACASRWCQRKRESGKAKRQTSLCASRPGERFGL